MALSQHCFRGVRRHQARLHAFEEFKAEIADYVRNSLQEFRKSLTAELHHSMSEAVRDNKAITELQEDVTDLRVRLDALPATLTDALTAYGVVRSCDTEPIWSKLRIMETEIADLRDANLAKPLDAGLSEAGSFRPGDLVLIHGLQQRSALNGCYGYLQAWMADKLRWQVDVEGTADTGFKLLRPGNLCKVDSAPIPVPLESPSSGLPSSTTPSSELRRGNKKARTGPIDLRCFLCKRHFGDTDQVVLVCQDGQQMRCAVREVPRDLDSKWERFCKQCYDG